MSKNYLNDQSRSRGLRNNNPGNLIRTSDAWQGKIPFDESQDNHFEQFKTLPYGIRAFLKNAITQLNGTVNTVEKFISKYAPSTENNTASYIKSVAKSLGLSTTAKLPIDKATLKALAKAVFIVEIGSDFELITDKDYDDAFSILGVQLPNGAEHCKICGAVLGGLAVFFFTYFSFVIA